MRVLFTSLRQAGHFTPLVPYLTACRDAGHAVAVAAPADLAADVAKHGVAFHPVPHPGDAALQPLWERMAAASRRAQGYIVIREIFAGACARAALPGVVDAAEQFRPDVLVRESQEYASIAVAEARGVPHVRGAISLYAGDMRTYRVAAQEIDALRAAAGATADPSGARMQAEPVLSMFPSSFEEPESPGGDVVRRFRAHATRPSSTIEEPPFVYVTFGTVASGMERLRGVYEAALRALDGLPVHALFTTGRALDPASLGTPPPNVDVQRFVPQDDVLPRARVVVNHGGSGTVLGALAHGAPMVLVPMFADQHDNAARAAATGCAAVVENPDAASIRAAIERTLADASLRACARALADEIAALPPMSAAVDALRTIAGA